MFTANTMNCLTEALGMGLPGNGTIPAVDARRHRPGPGGRRADHGAACRRTSARGISSPRTRIHNAFTVDMALGGSTNSVLHLMAIAHEAGIDFPLADINEISESTPYLCKLRPAGTYHIEDLDRAGGIPAVMKELSRPPEARSHRQSPARRWEKTLPQAR